LHLINSSAVRAGSRLPLPLDGGGLGWG
jgi:hypothetical protein